jgi:hypothetical protein
VNLAVPVNLQALRVTPNDASLITKRSDFFAGPTSSFEELPWRDPSFTEHPGRISRANLSANVVNPLSGSVAEQLDAGIHLHWALPDGLTRSVQQPDGTLAFPAVPNRWLVTRILQRAGQLSSRQWVVESDHLMTEAEYTGTYYPAARRKAVSVPVGWALAAGNDPQRDGGALYYPPSRRLGKVFELSAWQPTASPEGTPPDQVRHLDELQRQAHAFVQGTPPGALKAVGPSGPAFAAYYPDSRSAFGFHDRLEDLGADLGDAAFQVSYHVVGWHSHASDDPLQSPRLAQALGKANADNANAPLPASPAQVAADAVRETYRWSYDPAAGTPSRCVYAGQLAGLRWDTTKPLPGDPRFPQCYLQPPGDDPSVRLSVGSSSSSAMAALVKHEWAEWAGSGWSPAGGQAPDIGEQIERDLEFLIDALQLGILHELGTSSYLPQLEQALHRAEFGSLAGGQLWTIGTRESAADPSDPDRFNPPEAQLPADGNDLAGKLATLNACQTRLDALLGTADSCRRQIFSDWYHYIGAVGSEDADPGTNALKEQLKGYISGQILDLWAKLDAAFGTKTAPALSTANLPVFYSGAGDYLGMREGRYTTASPLPALAAQIAAAANAILTVLAGEGYENFELRRVERARFWQPNEPVVVATGEGLRPAQRNGTARYLPCRVSGQLLQSLQATAGGAETSVSAADAAAAAALAVPELAASPTPEAANTRPLLDDARALLGEACLLDPTLAPVLAAKLGGAVPAGDLQGALNDVAGQIARAWRAGAPEGAALSIPAVLTGLCATAGTLQVTLPGQAPQGAGLTARPGDVWEDPFLPLFLVWKASFRAPQKGAALGGTRYDPAFVTSRFQLDENTIDLVPSGGAMPTEAGAATLSGSIPLSSRAADPLLDQIRQYLQEHPTENPQLQAVIDHLRDKPLLSQGLSGINPALLSRAEGMQLTVFNPFYDAEPPATELGAGTDTLSYANVLTHFVGWAAGALADQVPLGEAGFNPLRSGYLDVVSAEVVDVFGRKRRVVDAGAASDAGKVVVAQQLKPPAGTTAQIGFPPRLAQPARLLLEWVSGNDGRMVTNSHPATSPVTGWVVSNYLDYSLMLFAPSGQPLGSLGVFGAQSGVAWQSAPGNPARPMETDLGAPELEHLLKFATFIHGRPRGFFDALMASIENAHTYILSDGAGGDQPYAVLMGRPLALVRAELRLELAGLPAFDTGLAAVRAAMAANGGGAYDWTLRDDAGLRDVDFPVRLGDRNHLSDGLVGYFIDGPVPYDTFYAPAAAAADGTGVRRPAPDTLRLKLRPALDPPDVPYPGPAAQTAALEDATVRSVRTAVTLLMDPRAAVHATTGVLPVKEIDLPAESYARALRSIEVAFFTHPVLRGAQGLELPVPDEAGFTWHWTMGVKQDGTARPQDEELRAPATGDRAHFSFSPQIAQDGWLKLVPQPPQSGSQGAQ